MAVTFSSACSAAAPVIYDTTASQATGAMSTGINVTGADASTPAGLTYIGGVALPAMIESTGTIEAPSPPPPPPPTEGRRTWN